MKAQTPSSKKTILIDEFIDHHTQDPRLAESLRYLRTNLEFSFIDNEYHSLLVTSADQAEGKSTVSILLAYVLSQSGKKTLIVDADLRKPKISHLINTQTSFGLSTILTETLNMDIQSGSFQDYSMSDLVKLIPFKKKTGILHTSQNGEEVDLHFLNGKLIDVHWLTRPKEKMLLSLLVQNSVITQEQAGQSLNRQKDLGQQMGYILLNMGFINQETLSGFIKLHIIEGLRIALQFYKGSFSFEKMPLSRYERPSYFPFDVNDIYQEIILGTETFPFLQKSIYSCIVESNFKDLFFLPAGPIPFKPSEILGSTRMTFLLSFLKGRFDAIVIDSSPILPTSDPLLIASQVEGVILVVKSKHLNHKIILNAIEQLQTARASLIGAVLNQADFKNDRYYQYYSKYYDESG